MAIKITYVFLKTISIATGAKLYASDGFTCNDNQPIKALKNLYFIKENDEIKTKIFTQEIPQIFFLPECLDETLFNQEIEPLYVLPAV
ncbi:MAG: hypothetical protein PHN38_00720 [Sulfurospirillaceae bacterium]|nr:hypothetical protein [Sulfurospirillaceae bacterium]